MRRFALTWNNYKDEDLEKIANTGHSYIIVGKEVGKSGTPHYQIYVEYKNPITFSQCIKKFYKKAHVEVARSDAETNITYCSKEDKIFEEGEPFRQGKRNDLSELLPKIEAGKNIKQIIIENECNYQGIKYTETLMKYFEPKREIAPIEVIWCYGGTGSGKSRWAHEENPDAFKP